jgi:hypothetical protein
MLEKIYNTKHFQLKAIQHNKTTYARPTKLTAMLASKDKEIDKLQQHL